MWRGGINRGLNSKRKQLASGIYLLSDNKHSHNTSCMLLVHNNQTRFKDIHEHPVHATVYQNYWPV